MCERCSKLRSAVEDASSLVVERDIYGFEELSVEERDQLVCELQKEGQPEHLEALDPNDSSFIKRVVADCREAAPSQLMLPMLPFQEIGFGWMKAQERSEFKGGILADVRPPFPLYPYTKTTNGPSPNLLKSPLHCNVRRAAFNLDRATCIAPHTSCCMHPTRSLYVAGDGDGENAADHRVAR